MADQTDPTRTHVVHEEAQPTATEQLLYSALADAAKGYRDLAEAVMRKVEEGGSLRDVIEVAVDYLDGRDYLDDDSIALFERAKAALAGGGTRRTLVDVVANGEVAKAEHATDSADEPCTVLHVVVPFDRYEWLIGREITVTLFADSPPPTPGPTREQVREQIRAAVADGGWLGTNGLVNRAANAVMLLLAGAPKYQVATSDVQVVDVPAEATEDEGCPYSFGGIWPCVLPPGHDGDHTADSGQAE